VKVQTSRRLGLVAGLFLAALVWSASANAGSLRQGSTGSGSTVTGSLPGKVLWTYYQTAIGPNGFQCPPESNLITDGLCETAGVGDNILRLINPNGGANGNLAGAKEQTVCAMIYVFDDDEEMGECCGCPLSSTQLATFSTYKNLTSNWGIKNPESLVFGEPTITRTALSLSSPQRRIRATVRARAGRATVAAIQPTIPAIA
jgi:hypothetical protein